MLLREKYTDPAPNAPNDTVSSIGKAASTMAHIVAADGSIP
jgi:hypothetical protein